MCNSDLDGSTTNNTSNVHECCWYGGTVTVKWKGSKLATTTYNGKPLYYGIADANNDEQSENYNCVIVYAKVPTTGFDVGYGTYGLAGGYGSRGSISFGTYLPVTSQITCIDKSRNSSGITLATQAKKTYNWGKKVKGSDWGTTAPAYYTYTNCSEVFVIGDMSVYRYYTPIEYNITYNLNGGGGVTNRTYNVETATFTLPNPTKRYNIFKGWTGSNGSTPQTNVSIAKGSNGAKSYTANWEPIYSSITGQIVTDEPASNGKGYIGWRVKFKLDTTNGYPIAYYCFKDTEVTPTDVEWLTYTSDPLITHSGKYYVYVKDQAGHISKSSQTISLHPDVIYSNGIDTPKRTNKIEYENYGVDTIVYNGTSLRL